jgi:hypothetical protein
MNTSGAREPRTGQHPADPDGFGPAPTRPEHGPAQGAWGWWARNRPCADRSLDNGIEVCCDSAALVKHDVG